MTMPLILAIDHGTTRTKAIAFDEELRPVAEATVELSQHYPRPGWVEHDPVEIRQVAEEAIRRCLAAGHLAPETISTIGLANQGETVVVWDRATGRPVYNAIVWQDRRTLEVCERLKREGRAGWIHERTGVPIDPYFSATKIAWILDHVPDGRSRAAAGDLLAGTTDAWLVWHLSGRRLHLTDPSTASRTMLFNLHTLDWDDELLNLFQIPRSMLPTVVLSAGVAGELGGQALGDLGFRRPVPLAGLAVDQQAALFGHGCLEPGMAKITYGTGAFILMTTGPMPRLSPRGLITTVAWRLPNRVDYALDGGVFAAGGMVQWLVDGLGLIETVDESASLAASVEDSGGVFAVPALAGLAAPHWVPEARAAIFGLTAYTTRAHLVRAVLEGIAFSVCDVVGAMLLDTGIPLTSVRADGAPTRNETLMQIQADLLGRPVEIASVIESTAAGVAGLAGVGMGWWRSEDVAAKSRTNRVFQPGLAATARQSRQAEWNHAVDATIGWSKQEP